MPGSLLAEDEEQRPHDVVLVHQLEAGVEAEHRGHERQPQRLAERRDDVGPEHVREAQQRDLDVRVVDGEVADVTLDLDEAALDAGVAACARGGSPR